MRTVARVLGISGGLILLIAGADAVIRSHVDTAIVGAWATVASGLIGIAGGAVAMRRPRLAVLLTAIAAAIAGLVAPGVIPAIADITLVFLGYLLAGAFLVAAAVIAFLGRNKAASGSPTPNA